MKFPKLSVLLSEQFLCRMEAEIKIAGARVNNLRNLTLGIPRDRLVVVTGVSGSGKSSLVFDTLFAEGQRRFAESLSSYARQFLGRMTKPDVDSLEGIPPAIAIEQKVSTKNPRSTVATTTEIYDFVRLVFARIGRTYSPVSGKEVHADGVRDVVRYMESLSSDRYVLAHLGWRSRTDRTELLLRLKEDGYSRLWAGGSVLKIDDALRAGADSIEEAFLLVDRFSTLEDRDRLLASVERAFAEGRGDLRIVCGAESRDFCSRFEADGIRFREPDDYLFSFNSPLGACPVCGGLGKIIGISEDLVVPDKSRSIYDGAIACWRGEKMGWFRDQLIRVAPTAGLRIFEPYCKLTKKERDFIWNAPYDKEDPDSPVSISEFFRWVETQRYKIQYKYMLSRFSGRTTCSSCGGSRLREEALWVKVGGKNIAEVLDMTAAEAAEFFRTVELSDSEREIVAEPLREIQSRLECILEVGLGYLTLSRASNTLSGGESQRVSLVTALGSSLVGSMYILDEPSIGLHPRDTQRLIGVLKRLRDIGNTVVVVEHDEEIIRAADVLIDMGPGAGVDGGRIVFQGAAGSASPSEVSRSLTLQYLGGRGRYSRTKRTPFYSITLEGAMEHNLKNIDVRFPLDVLTVVSGVSGSGKSTLVGDILYPALHRHLNDAGDQPGAFRALSGNVDRISRVEYVDQNPIGRSSRSNAATYLKVYDVIRKLLSDQQAAKIGGLGPSHFSFNQEGGRCPECQGEGVVRIPMQFMADVEMVCESCGGKRFKPEVLEVKYRGRNVSDILDMSVVEAIEFFSEGPEAEAQEVAARLQPLVDVGLGYIKLGQSSSTLSGGESQRIKLAYFLSMKEKRERILFIFDEPTTGLHFRDVETLLKAFDSMLAAGHSLIVGEHNPDVIRAADYLIDLGPEAGEDGGRVVYAGPPENIGDTHTGRALRE